MNEEASISFGEYYKRIPLTKSATIKHGNVLQMDWQSLIDTKEKGFSNNQPSEIFLNEKGHGEAVENFDFIFGNPPLVGKQYQNAEQKADMESIFANLQGVMEVFFSFQKKEKLISSLRKLGHHLL